MYYFQRKDQVKNFAKLPDFNFTLFRKIRAGLDISYRFYHDDFGINFNTLALTWRQKITDMFILEPSYRFYNQSAANFYDSSFKFGNPDANANNTPEIIHPTFVYQILIRTHMV